MNNQSESVPQPLGKNTGEPQPAVPPAGPSMNSDHQPVSENDNSANLFEEHIKELKKDS